VSYVRIKEASEILGVSDSAIVASAKYKPFHIKTDNKRESYFDIQGYRHRQDIENQLLEKTKLFIEYLVHEEGIGYSYMAKKSKIPVQALSNHAFSVKKAFGLMKWFKFNRPYLIDRFDNYYGWKTVRHYRDIFKYSIFGLMEADKKAENAK